MSPPLPEGTWAEWVYDWALLVRDGRVWIAWLVVLAVLSVGGIKLYLAATQGMAEVIVGLWVRIEADELVSARATSGELARAAGLAAGDRVMVRSNGKKETRELVLITTDGVAGVILANRLAEMLLEDLNGPPLRAWERAEEERRAVLAKPSQGLASLPLMSAERPQPRLLVTDRAVSAKRSPITFAYPIATAAVAMFTVCLIAVYLIEVFRREHRRRQGGRHALDPRRAGNGDVSARRDLGEPLADSCLAVMSSQGMAARL